MANRYWVGDGGNWSDNANHWSATDGGAPNASLPTSADNVFFTANSFTIGSQTVTVDATAYSKDMDWTGVTNTPTFSTSNVLRFYGNVTFIAAMVSNGGTGLRAYATSGVQSLRTNGLALTFTVLWENVGGSSTGELLDDFTSVSTLGAYRTFNTNNFNIIATNFRMAFTQTKTISLGSSVITLSNTWNADGTNITIVPGSSTIKLLGTGAFVGGGKTYYDVELNGTAHTISGDNTFSTLTLKADTTQTITFTDGSVQTITTPVMTGSVGKVKTLQGSDVTGWSIVKAGGGTVIADYLALSYSQASPTDTWYHGDNCTIGAGVTGWFPIIKTPVADGDLIGIAVIRKN